MKKARLYFVKGVEVEFVDREQALKSFLEIAERGTRLPLVIYGPEGCGKTALLKQIALMLDELGYRVVYFNPLEDISRAFWVSPSIREVVHSFLETLPKPVTDLAKSVLSLANFVMDRFARERIAILLDDVFQAIGLDKAELYVKSLLNIIEYPPTPYESIVVVVTSSEGVTRSRIGRHNWASMMMIWNMARDGFEQLYDKIPNPKPDFEYVWRAIGGNPRYLGELYEFKWDIDRVIEKIIEKKGITLGFVAKWRTWLEEAVEDPDALWSPEAPEELIKELVERNLIVYFLSKRDQLFWVDTPPPEKDLELGIGRYIAWQAPLHREAVRKALMISR